MTSKILFVLLIYVGVQSTLCAQKISNVVVNQEDQHIIIEYELIGLVDNEEANVTVSYSKDQEHFHTVSKGLTGDFGRMISFNGQKSVKWDVLEQNEIFEGSYTFKVEAVLRKVNNIDGIERKLIHAKRYKNKIIIEVSLKSPSIRFIDLNQYKKTHFIEDQYQNKFYVTKMSNNNISMFGDKTSRLILSPNVEETVSIEIEDIPYGLLFIKKLVIFDKSRHEVIDINDFDIL